MTEAYRIAIPHFWCLEYYEGNKKMTVDIDFRDEKYYLNTKLISSWEAPFENEIITNDEKRRIIKNIATELKKRFQARKSYFTRYTMMNKADYVLVPNAEQWTKHLPIEKRNEIIVILQHVK